jgi:hypothetical protein
MDTIGSGQEMCWMHGKLSEIRMNLFFLQLHEINLTLGYDD